MRYNPGDPVWVQNNGQNAGACMPTGRYAGVVTAWHCADPTCRWYDVDIEKFPSLAAGQTYMADESILSPRRDGDSKEPLGEWELCPWKPKETKVSSGVYDKSFVELKENAFSTPRSGGKNAI